MKFTKEQLIRLHSSLLEVLNGALKGCVARQYEGICSNWTKAFDAYLPEDGCYDIVQHIAMDWPDSRLPGIVDCYPIKEDDCFGKWQGPNLASRISLMRYILKRLRDWKRRAK